MLPEETNGAVTGIDLAELSQLQTLLPSYPEITKVILFLVPEQKEQRERTRISKLRLTDWRTYLKLNP